MTEKKYPPRVWIPVFSALYSQSGEEFEPWESYRYGASRRFSFKYTKEAPEPFVSVLEHKDLLKKKDDKLNKLLRIALSHQINTSGGICGQGFTGFICLLCDEPYDQP